MIYIIDIDGTICFSPPSGDYTQSQPIQKRIDRVNQLYDQGNVIIYWTARGMSRGLDFSELTERQLKQWGCKYNDLRMRKPVYDVWVDDKAKWLFDGED
jgi:hypothetical protein